MTTRDMVMATVALDALVLMKEVAAITRELCSMVLMFLTLPAHFRRLKWKDSVLQGAALYSKVETNKDVVRVTVEKGTLVPQIAAPHCRASHDQYLVKNGSFWHTFITNLEFENDDDTQLQMISLPARPGGKEGPSLLLGFEEPQTLYDDTPNDDLESFEDQHQKMFNFAKKFLMEALMLDKLSRAVSFIFFETNVIAVCAKTIENQQDMPGQGPTTPGTFQGRKWRLGVTDLCRSTQLVSRIRPKSNFWKLFHAGFCQW